jgi:hypothetical protein
MFGFSGTCQIFTRWTVTVWGKIIGQRAPGDVRPFKCEPASDENLYVAGARRHHLSERHERDLQIAVEE